MIVVHKFGNPALVLSMIVSLMFLFALPVYANNEAVASTETSNVQAGNYTVFGRLADGQYTFNVKINGQGPFIFMVDTGASRTSIFETTRQVLGLEKRDAEQRFVRGMTGSEIRPTALVTQLEFSKKRVENHSVIILENWSDQTERLDGILGMDVLSDLILAFDHDEVSTEAVKPKHQTGSIRVLKKRSLRARQYRKWTRIPLTKNPYPVAKYGLWFTDMRVGDLRIPTLFDTGASFTAISWDIVDGTPLRKEKKRLREEWVVRGAVGTFKPRIRINMDKVVIGGVPVKRHEILVMDFEGLPINKQGEYPLVITGVDFLRGHDFVLDTKSGELILDVKPARKRNRGLINPSLTIPSSRLPL